MDVAWNSKGSILLYPNSRKKGTQQQSLNEQMKYEIVELVPTNISTWYSIPAIQRLLNESHAIFERLQRISVSSGDEPDAKDLLSVSHQYQSVLRCACVSLHNYVPNDDNIVDSDLLHSFLNLYENYAVIWSLAELIYVKPKDRAVSLDLVDWAKVNFRQADHYIEQILQSGTNTPENHPHFWNAVYLYVLHGRCDDACRMLLLHSRKNESAFRSVDELLRKMPLESLNIDDTQWIVWQEECVRRWEENHFMEHPELEVIVRILSGEKTILSEAGSSLLGSWYEAMTPMVLYQYPATKIFQLQEYIGDAMQLVPIKELAVLDRTLMSLFELDVIGAFKELSGALPDWWLCAHLADLLQKAGCDDLRQKFTPIQSKQRSLVDSDMIDLREYLILDFATSLISHQSLWQLGISYLDSCQVRGSHLLELCLERMSIDSDYKAMKIMKICDDRGFSSTTKSICKQLALSALKENNLSVALTWCLQSKDNWLINMVAERVMFQCDSDDGCNSVLDGLHLLDQFGEIALGSSSLLFLGKYRDYQQLRNKGDVKRAGDVLVQLLTSRLAPRRFWSTLLHEATSLMASNRGKIVFDKTSTYNLMELLMAIEIELDTIRTSLNDQNQIELSNQIKQFRILLVRNLAVR